MSEFGRFWGDLTELARVAAHARSTSPQQELQQFVLQRIMARAFHRDPDDWLLKGAQNLLARFPDARTTGDVDLIDLAGRGREQMTADFNSALTQDLGDHLTFEQVSEMSLMHGAGVRLGHRVNCGGRELFELTTDLLPPDGRAFWVPPEHLAFPEQLLRTGADGEAPHLLAISVQDQLAHKLSGMYEHGLRDLETKCEDCLPAKTGRWSCRGGDLPHRVQDLVDIAFLAEKLPWDAVETHQLTLHERRNRLAQGAPLELPNRFRVPNPSWVPGFAKYAAITPGLRHKTIKAAWPMLDNFVTPMLSPEPPSPGTWRPGDGAWIEKSTGQAVTTAQQTRQRVLVVSHLSGRSTAAGGLPVVSGELTTALAGLENTDVTLLTFTGTEPHGAARIIEIEPEGYKPIQLRRLSTRDWPATVGLPAEGTDSFDVVIGHARFSGPAAMNIRNRWYRFAKFVYVMHMPQSEYSELQGRPDLAAIHAAQEKEVFQAADLVVGVGPLLTQLARDLDLTGSGRLPSYHELIPGHAIREAIPEPDADGTFRLLFGAQRPHDAVKGYADLLKTVKQLRKEGLPVVLDVRGLPPEEVSFEQVRVDQVIGDPGVVRILPFSTDEAVLDEDLHRAHVLVMPSKIEGYGKVAAEGTERGVPVLVPERSGYGQALLDSERFPAELAAASVVRDAGLTGQDRIDAWKTALRDLMADYPARRAQAVELQAVHQHYTWQDAATALAEAMKTANPGAQRYTIQAADGAVRLVEDVDTQAEAEALIAAKRTQLARAAPTLVDPDDQARTTEDDDLVAKFATLPATEVVTTAAAPQATANADYPRSRPSRDLGRG